MALFFYKIKRKMCESLSFFKNKVLKPLCNHSKALILNKKTKKLSSFRFFIKICKKSSPERFEKLFSGYKINVVIKNNVPTVLNAERTKKIKSLNKSINRILIL